MCFISCQGSDSETDYSVHGLEIIDNMTKYSICMPVGKVSSVPIQLFPRSLTGVAPVYTYLYEFRSVFKSSHVGKQGFRQKRK